MTRADEIRKLKDDIVSLLDKLLAIADECPECGKELDFTASFIKGEAAYLATHVKNSSTNTSCTVPKPERL